MWQIRWYAAVEGHVRTGSRSFSAESDADDFKADCEASISVAQSETTAIVESLAHAVAHWKSASEKLHTDRTRGLYEDVIDRFLASLPAGVADVSQVSAKHIQNYLAGMAGTNRTGNSHLTAIKSFFRYMAGRHQIPYPAATVRMLPEDPPKARFLTPEEYRQVVAVADDEMKDVIRFLAHTGLRISELTSLTGANVKGKLLTVIGKGRKRRHVPLDATAQEVLTARNPRPGKSVFSFSLSQYMRPRQAILDRCYILATHAGVPSFGPHALRHLFATELLRHGAPISHVSQLLGHSSIKTTERVYIHFLPGYLDGATDLLAHIELPE
jgi:integrase